jgi:hypothetical protein
MAIAYRADRSHACTVSVWDGDVTADDVRHHLARLAVDEDWPAGPAHLTDLTTIKTADVPDPELLALLYEGTTLAEDLKIAVVVRAEPRFEPALRYETATAKLAATTFDDLGTACRYLGVSAPAMQATIAELRQQL